jgi:hypothetical protein
VCGGGVISPSDGLGDPCTPPMTESMDGGGGVVASPSPTSATMGVQGGPSLLNIVIVPTHFGIFGRATRWHFDGDGDDAT